MAVQRFIRLKAPVKLYGKIYSAGTKMAVVTERELAYELKTPDGYVGTLPKSQLASTDRPLSKSLSREYVEKMDQVYQGALKIIEKSKAESPTIDRVVTPIARKLEKKLLASGILTLVDKNQTTRVNESSSRGRVVAFLRERGGQATWNDLTAAVGKEAISAVRALTRKGWIVQGESK